MRQYKKNIGRDVEITTLDEKKKAGRLIAVTEEKITLESSEGKGKKAIVKTEEMSFTEIKQTKVQIKF